MEEVIENSLNPSDSVDIQDGNYDGSRLAQCLRNNGYIHREDIKLPERKVCSKPLKHNESCPENTREDNWYWCCNCRINQAIDKVIELNKEQPCGS